MRPREEQSAIIGLKLAENNRTIFYHSHTYVRGSFLANTFSLFIQGDTMANECDSRIIDAKTYALVLLLRLYFFRTRCSALYPELFEIVYASRLKWRITLR